MIDIHTMAEPADILEAVFSTISEVILVIDPETRTVIHCNEAVREVFGYEPREVIGRNTKALHVSDAQYEEFGRASESVLDRGERYRAEMDMRRKNGSSFPAEISVASISARRLWLDGVISVIRDITRRKRDEEIRRRNQQRLRLITEQLPAIVWTTDADLRVTSLTGRGSGSIRRTGGWYEDIPLREFLADRRGAEEGMRAHESALQGRPASYQIHFDGIDLEAHVEPFFEDDQVTGTVGVAHDVSDRIRYEDVLASSVREKETLIREIQHRVKNNLQLIKSMLGLQARATTNEDARDVLAVAERRVQSLAEAHDRLLHGESVTAVDMSEYLGAVAQGLVTASGRAIDLEVAVDAIPLYLDTAVPCGLIVSELVSNSIQHAFPHQRGGRIRINFTREHDMIFLVVSDDGVGAPSDSGAHEAETGLQLVNALVSQLGGTMEMEVNDGTRARVSFTARDGEAAG